MPSNRDPGDAEFARGLRPGGHGQLEPEDRAPGGGKIRADATPAAIGRALGLTAREAEILSWVVQGKINPEIGTILGIQLTTVKKHLESIFMKLGVENRTAAVTPALEKVTPQG